MSNLTNRAGITGKTNTELLNAPVTTKNQISGFCYDIAGNLLSQLAPCPTQQNQLPYNPFYIYDAENRLRSIQLAITPWYTYDGDGKRVMKTGAAGNRLYWTGTGSDTLTETDLNGTATADYIYFNGKRVARVDLPSGNVRYYFSDHLGSSNVVTDASGVIKDESDFYPYGGELAITNSDPNRYKFTGKERDTESGLDNFGARYYGSSLGRFMTPDWAAKPVSVPYANFGNPQSLNLYSYVQNNPTTVGDPDGHDPDGFALERIYATADPQTKAAFQRGKEIGALAGLAFYLGIATGGEVWESVFLRNLLGISLATAPRTVPIIAGAIEGLAPGPSGSLTISSATRLSEQEISTGVRLASQTGKGLAESAHVGEEFVDAAGKTYDAMGGGKAFEHFGDGSKFFDSIVSHVNKSVDVVALDLKGASKGQVGAIKDFVKTLTKDQQKKITYVN